MAWSALRCCWYRLNISTHSPDTIEPEFVSPLVLPAGASSRSAPRSEPLGVFMASGGLLTQKASMPLRPPQYRPATYRPPIPKVRDAYYGSTNWKQLRADCLARDGNKCTKCGSTHRLAAHHIIERACRGNDALTNLTILCSKCHNAKHRSRSYRY
jgi:5-methylcytosine-specific restriction protein A